jgi:large repetitive protein
MRLKILFILVVSSWISHAQMVMSGVTTGSCDCYEVTHTTNQAGSVWSPSTISLANPFDFSFEINLGVNDTWGADGMVFVLRQAGTTTGALGNGMGYGGITNSVGIEVDTWNSSPTVPTDVASDHLGMSSNGTVNHNLVSPVSIANIEDGAFHTFRAVWDPVAMEMEVFLDGVSIFTYTGDLVALYFGGNPNVYFGWTGGTGGVANVQTVCMYRAAEFSSDVLTACVGQEVDFTDESTSDLIYNLDEAITWDWDFDDGSSSALENPTRTFAATGTYTVSLTITDVSGCSSTVTHDIVITPGLSVTMTHTDVSCFGIDDGTGTATPTTGTGPYSYVWDDPLTQITPTSIDLAPSTYAVIVTDALGCVGTGFVTTLEPAELILDSATPTNVSCGLANGTITIVASGGTPALEYSINGGVTYFPSGVFAGLTNGTYNVVVRDANGCTVSTTTVVALDSPLIIDEVITTDVSCGPTDDGTITINASAGVPPFQYSIDGGLTYFPSNYFDLLSPGSYTVSVLDDAGCSVSATAVVGSLSTVVYDAIIITDATCNGGADGSIDISVSGGTAPYQYSIDGGASFFATNLFTGLIAGTYDIEVTDDAGCNVTEVAIIGEPSAISIDLIDMTAASCAGLADGEFDLTVSGGTPGYEYSNDGGVTFQISSIFSGLPAGAYDIVIRDANSCLQTGTAIVTEPALLMIDAIAVVDVTCNGLMDGEITVTAIGGTPAYQYRVDGGAYQLSPTFTGLSGGSITVDVIDPNACFATLDAFLAEADPIVLTMGPDTTICLGGEANLCPVITGGTAPYSFLWDGIPDTYCLTTSIIGVHNLQVEDVNGCTSEVLDQTVFQYEPLSVFASASITICPGDDVVLAGEAGGDGPAGYTYEWTNDSDASILFGPVQNVNPETTTTYTLTVSSGCENTASTTVTVTTYPMPIPLITSDITEGCEDLMVNFSALSDPALVSTLVWDFGDGTVGEGWDLNHLYTDPMCYTVTLDITSVNGCEISGSFVDFICVWPQPIANFEYIPTQPDLYNTTVDFSNTSTAATAYEWTFGEGSSSSETNPSNTYPAVGNVNYEVQLIAKTDLGCADTTSQIITIDELVVFFIPNAFTPNSDPFNPNFGPVFIPGFTPRDYHFMIFNRWGELIWESTDMSETWGGDFINGRVDDGTYVWELTFRENKSDKKYRNYGHVSVIK